jgi:ribosomal protein L10
MYEEMKSRAGDGTVFFSSFDALSVIAFEQLRDDIRELSGQCFVVKKTLLRRYFQELKVDELGGLLDGQILMTSAEEDVQKMLNLPL